MIYYFFLLYKSWIATLDLTNGKIGDQPTALVESATFCRLGAKFWSSFQNRTKNGHRVLVKFSEYYILIPMLIKIEVKYKLASKKK